MQSLSSSRGCGFAAGTRLTLRAAVPRALAAARSPVQPLVAELERLRLHNLSPEVGSRKNKTRVGRGHSAGQGGSCGRGMRGQLANSPGIRVGFEGGQMPLYRRLPKLRGIAGGMPAGRKTHVTVNLSFLAAAVSNGQLTAGSEVTLASLKEAGLVKASGAERNLPLKVLAGGDLVAPLTIVANAFSAGAREKIAAAGGQLVEAPSKPKWSRKAHEERVRAAGGSVVAGKSIPKPAAKAAKAKKA